MTATLGSRTPAPGGRPALRASLESLVETAALGTDVLHPGGLGLTEDLAHLCHVGAGSVILDVASGTGESACYLAHRFGCRVVGLDISEDMVRRAHAKLSVRQLRIWFLRGDAHTLPFRADTFDAVISECTLCLLAKNRAIREMARVAKPRGYVGIHDICWKENTPDRLKRRLAELENESPETLEGWEHLFREAGLTHVIAVNRSDLLPGWTRDIKRRFGARGQLRIALLALANWGVGGLMKIMESERIFRSQHTGYGLIVGRKT